MEKFLVAGLSSSSSKKLQLILPAGKHYKICGVKNGEADLKTEALLDKAANRRKSEAFHMPPVVNQEELPRTLQYILSRYPYPVSQGPVVFPLDFYTADKWKYQLRPAPTRSESDVLTAKTLFSHDASQTCYEWHPAVSGVTAWGTDGVVGYNVKDLQGGLSLVGPASSMNMGVMYSCTLANCIVYCPCTVCTDPRKTCKRLCKAEVCQKCNSQCTRHVVKLPRLFSGATDHFTMVTEIMSKYIHVHPYAGIPQDCPQCTRDVKEHQLLHMVWHVRCRFCRMEMRPLSQKSVVTLSDYKEAEKILMNVDGRTCAFCLVQSQDSFARKKHEEVMHERKAGKFECDLCDGGFSNKNALQYHKDSHEELKVTCELCGFKSSSKSNLTKHIRVHSKGSTSETQHQCEVCVLKFSNYSNYKRHRREKHYDYKANLDFVEDMDAFNVVKCEKCTKTFKRLSDLKRHNESVHETTGKTVKCDSCEKGYTRKDALKRHVKSVHLQDL